MEKEFTSKYKAQNDDPRSAYQRNAIMDSEALREVHTTCVLCGYTGMCHLPASTSHVCLQCGYERVYGITDQYTDNCLEADERRVLPYQYEPSKYLQQQLDCIQGIRRRAFSAKVLATIERGLARANQSRTVLTPAIMKHVLKQVDLPSYYKHRCALTKHFNPTYQPVVIPLPVQQQLHALFRSCYARLAPELEARDKPRKNFVSYQVFMERALYHLGHPKLARDCEPLKGTENQAFQVSVLDEILSELVCSTVTHAM